MFSKKISIEKDRLMKRFDPINGYYYVKMVNGELITIDFESLDRKSKKILLKENKRLVEDEELYNKELKTYQDMQRFKFLERLGYPCDSFQVMGKINGSISDELKEYLDVLLSKKDSLVGIHRVKSSFTESDMQDIFLHGLKITGHLDGFVSNNHLKNNVSYYVDNRTILKELMYANLYKNSIGSILIEIPDEDLIKNTDILIDSLNHVRLNPKYIVGYVPLYENNHIENIILNPNFKKEITSSSPKI